MAKGLRSKVKRANRTALRESLTIPLQVKRQQEISLKIKEDLKKSSGSTIANLKSLISKPSSNVTDEVEPEMEEVIQFEDHTPTARKRSGSKPRRNGNKELTWFK